MYSIQSSQLPRGGSQMTVPLTTIRCPSRHDSPTAEDEFCRDLERRLSLVKEWRDRGVANGPPLPWYPFPDSRHNSALETHTHRVSSVQTRETPDTNSSITPPARLHTKRYRRKLSADNVCREASLRPLTRVELFREQRGPANKLTSPTRTEATYGVDADEGHEDTTISSAWMTEEPAQPATKLTKAQEIRKIMAHRTKTTVYTSFDEAAFGRRSSPPPNPRRRSLLSIGFKAEDENSVESSNLGDAVDSQSMPGGIEGSRSDGVRKHQTTSPKSELRRDSGYDEADDALSPEPTSAILNYDFGKQDTLM